MPADREPPPPGLVAAVEQEYHHVQRELAELMATGRELLAARHTEVEAITDLWLTFMLQNLRRVAFLCATAVMQLIKAGDQRGTPGPPRGSPQ